jgi:hypothetical protein
MKRIAPAVRDLLRRPQLALEFRIVRRDAKAPIGSIRQENFVAAMDM